MSQTDNNNTVNTLHLDIFKFVYELPIFWSNKFYLCANLKLDAISTDWEIDRIKLIKQKIKGYTQDRIILSALVCECLFSKQEEWNPFKEQARIFNGIIKSLKEDNYFYEVDHKHLEIFYYDYTKLSIKDRKKIPRWDYRTLVMETYTWQLYKKAQDHKNRIVKINDLHQKILVVINALFDQIVHYGMYDTEINASWYTNWDMLRTVCYCLLQEKLVQHNEAEYETLLWKQRSSTRKIFQKIIGEEHNSLKERTFIYARFAKKHNHQLRSWFQKVILWKVKDTIISFLKGIEDTEKEYYNCSAESEWFNEWIAKDFYDSFDSRQLESMPANHFAEILLPIYISHCVSREKNE